MSPLWQKLTALGRRSLSAVDGEFLLRRMPNSGAVVVARSAWLSTLLLLAYIALTERLRPGSTWQFSMDRFRVVLAANLTLGGGIFAAAYVALYARFASQWTYLAGLYNQIMAVQLREGVILDKERSEVLALWMAGFIEDAVAVHLAEKPMYAAVIVNMLEDQQVREAYALSTVDGYEGLARLEKRLKAALGPAASRFAARQLSSAALEGTPDAG